MRTTAERTDEARRLIEKLVKISPDIGTTLNAKKMLDRINLVPMTVVISEIPGDTLNSKAAKLKVTRQTLYYWAKGITRPNRKQAKLIATMTKFTPAEIRGEG